MQDFFLGQMDYILFVYGLGLFLFAMMAFFLARIQKSGGIWKGLAMFGVLHGVAEWLSMAGLGFPQTRWLGNLQTCFLMASFLCFVEIACMNAENRYPRDWRRWLYGPLVIFVFGMGWTMGEWSGVNFLVRYCFGLLGALLASAAVFRFALRHQDLSGLVKMLAVTIGCYGALLIFVPSSGFLPSGWLTDESFLNFTGFPVPLARMCLVCVWAFLTWRIYILKVRGDAPDVKRFYTLREDLWFPAAVILVVFIGFLVTFFTGEQRIRHEQTNLLRVSRIVAASVVRAQQFDGLTDPLAGALPEVPVEIQDWKREIVHARFYAIIITGLFIALLVIFFVIRRREYSSRRLLLENERKYFTLSVELDEERRNLQTIFDSAQVGLVLVDRDFVVKRVNHVIPRMIEKSMEDILDRLPGDALCCLHATEAASGCGHAEACRDCLFRNTGNRIFETGEAVRGVEISHIVRNPSGKVRRLWLEVNASPLEINGGECLLFSISDVTARKAVEEEKAGQIDFLQKLIDAIPVPVLYKDSRGCYQGCNRMFEEYVGKPRAEIIGKTVHEIIPGEVADRYAAMDQALLESPGQQVYEGNVSFPVGSSRVVVFNKASFFDKSGKFLSIVGVISDITERKRMEDALRESRDRFNMVAEQVSEVIWETDSRGLYTYVSHVAETVWGFAPEEIVGKLSFYDLHPQESREEFKAEAFACFERKEVLKEIVNPVVTKAGVCRWMMTSALPMIGKDGELLGYRGSDTDITARRLAEQRLRESEERYRLLVEYAVGAIAVHQIVLDDAGQPVDYVFLSVNPAFELQTGLRAGDIVGRRVTDVLPGIERSSFISIYGRVALTGESVTFEQYVEQMQKYFYINAYSLGDGKFATVFADITERKRVEDVIREREAYYRGLINHAADAIFVHDTPSGRIVDCNQQAVSSLGYTREEMLNLSVSNLDMDYSAERDQQAWQTLIPGQTFSLQGRHRRKDGSVFPVEVNIVVIESSGRNLLVAAARDISERKRVERVLLEAKEAAEAASRIKGEFLANMSHEIRTPMNAIIGFGQLLKITSLTEKQLSYLDTIISSGRLLLGIINDILDIARVSSGKMSFEEIEFGIRDLFSECLAMVQSQFQVRNLVFRQDISDGVPQRVMGDTTRIKQVLVNLLSNAVKFTFQGTVTLTVRVMLEKDGRRARFFISVRDTGIGIPQEKFEKIFQPFEQVDMSTVREFGGTGLGLSICKGLVERMGGEIRVSSELGKGSEFSFTLTLRIPDVSCAEAFVTEHIDAVGQNMRVLVVEDTPSNRHLLQEYLSVLGCAADFACNGQEALVLLQKGGYDLCFMDLQMPVMSGEEATRIFRREHGPDLPVIALTAAAMPQDKERCLLAGMNDFLTKPVGITDLRDILLRYKRSV